MSDRPTPHSKKPEGPRRTHPGVLLGSTFAVGMGIFAWLGHLWDERSGWAPLGVLTGVAMGLLFGAYEVWKLVRVRPEEGEKRGETEE